MGDVTAYAYDSSAGPLTTSQGQTVNVASGSAATFANLPQSPGPGQDLHGLRPILVDADPPAARLRVTESGTGIANP